MSTDYASLTPTDVLNTLRTISATEYNKWYTAFACHPTASNMLFVAKTLTIREILMALLDNPNLQNPTGLDIRESSTLANCRQHWTLMLAEIDAKTP